MCRDPRGIFEGEKKRRKEPILPPSRGNPCTHTHMGKARTERGRFLSDMLTCRRATALPCGQGRRGRKGHGGGELKREAAGRGTEAPRGESRAKTKRKDGGWSLKTEQKSVSATQGTGRRGWHRHAAHTGKVLSAPCPSWGHRRAGDSQVPAALEVRVAMGWAAEVPGRARRAVPCHGDTHLLQLQADLVEGSQPVGLGSRFGVLHLHLRRLPARTHSPLTASTAPGRGHGRGLGIPMGPEQTWPWQTSLSYQGGLQWWQVPSKGPKAEQGEAKVPSPLGDPAPGTQGSRRASHHTGASSRWMCPGMNFQPGRADGVVFLLSL